MNKWKLLFCSFNFIEVCFDKCTHSCNHHHSNDMRHFVCCRRFPAAVYNHPTTSTPAPSNQMGILSPRIRVALSGAAHDWNHTGRHLQRLARHHVSELHSLRCTHPSTLLGLSGVPSHEGAQLVFRSLVKAICILCSLGLLQTKLLRISADKSFCRCVPSLLLGKYQEWNYWVVS